MHPLVEQIASPFLRPGAIGTQEAAEAGVLDVHRQRIAWEWASGQWVLLASPDNRLCGWMSWYRCTEEVLELLRADDYAELVRRGDPVRDLTQGPHCYICTAVTAPWAPRNAYRLLYRLTAEANTDAKIIAGWLRKRDGSARWTERELRWFKQKLH